MSECIEWAGTVGGRGYGNVKIAGRTLGAHRVAYCESVGLDPIQLPSSIYIRHDCDNKLCVNPDHLRPGTALDNYRDQIERGRRPPLKTECCHGHPYTEDNTFVDKRGRRHCRTCDRLRDLRRRPATKRGRYKQPNRP